MFASSSKRDLFLNNAFSKKMMKKVTGPLTPARVMKDVEKTKTVLEGKGKGPQYSRLGRAGASSGKKMKGKKKGPAQRSPGRPGLSMSQSAPTLGLDSARWDLNGQSFTKSTRPLPAQAVDPNNKKIYRRVRDIRTGKVVVAPVRKDWITTPNAQDLMLALDGVGGGVKTSVAPIHEKSPKKK